jgi:hypothetical protein
MNNIKAYTNINQSKVLAEILPIKSADMHYVLIDTDNNKYSAGLGKYIGILPHYPCWSLAALLDYIKNKCGYFELVYLKSTIDGRANRLENVYRLSTDIYDIYEKEAIDAAFKMIIKLHELNLL